jgi:hypothetical protein
MLSIKNAKTPTLVIHSQRDYRLDVSEGLQLFTALQRLNVPSKMLYFPDEGHWVLKPQNSKLWYETVGDWCDKWTKSNAYALAGFETPAAPVAVAKGASSTRTGVSRPVEMNEEQPLPEPAAAPPLPPVATAKTPNPKKTPAPVVRVPPAEPSPVVAPPPVAPPASAENTPQRGKGSGSFLIAISTPNDEVQLGSDARVVITLRNLAEHQILFAHLPGVERPEYSYTIVVRNAAGRVLEETAYGREARKGQLTDGRTVDYVQPGQSVVQTAHLGKLVNLSRPGVYRVQVSRRDPESHAVVESNEIVVNVVP